MSFPTLSQLGNPIVAFYPLSSTINGGGAAEGDAITTYTSPDGNTTGGPEDGTRPATFHASGFGLNSVPYAELKDANSSSDQHGGRMGFSPASGAVGISELTNNQAADGWSFIALYKAYGGNRGQVLSFNSRANNTGDGQMTFDDDGSGKLYRWPQTNDTVAGQIYNQPTIVTYTCSPVDGNNNIAENYYVNGGTNPTATFSRTNYYPGNQTAFFIGGAFYTQYAAFFAYQGVLTPQQRATYEGLLTNYAGFTYYTAPTVPPVVTSQVLASDGLTLTLTFSEAITGTTGFSVSVGGTNRSVTVTTPDTTHIVLTLGSVAYASDTVTVSYTPGNVVDANSTPLATFSNAAVTNNSTQTLPTAATPTFSVPAGTYGTIQNVTLACSTSSSTIYYTTNGNTPTTASTTYSSAIAVNASETIKALAAASGYANSAVASAAYTITIPTPTTVTVSPSTASVAVSTTQAFTATVYDQNSNVMNGQTVTWSASAGSITSPGSSATLTTPGTAQTVTVTVTAAVGFVHGTATVTVTAGGPPTLSQMGNPKVMLLPTAANVNGGAATNGATLTSVLLQSGQTTATQESRPGSFQTSGFGNNSVPYLVLSDSQTSSDGHGGGIYFATEAGIQEVWNNQVANGWSAIVLFNRNPGGGSEHALVSFNSVNSNNGNGLGTINSLDGPDAVYRWNLNGQTCATPLNQDIMLTYLNTPDGAENWFVNGGTTPTAAFANGGNQYSILTSGGSGVYMGRGLLGKYAGLVIWDHALTVSERATYEGLLNNYAAISYYTTPNTALVGNNTVTIPVGTKGRQTTYSVVASASSGGTAPYTYQFYETTNLNLTDAQIVAQGTPIGSNSTTLNRTGATAETTYKLVLKTTDSASSTVLSPTFEITTGGTKELFFAYVGDSTEATNPSGFGDDAQNFEDKLFVLNNQLSFASDPYTSGPGSDNNSAAPKPSTNYAASGSKWTDWVSNGTLQNAITTEVNKGASGAKVFHCSVGFNDATGVTPGITATAFLAAWHNAMQMFEIANKNIYYQLPWEWSQDVTQNSPNPLIPQYRSIVQNDVYNAQTNPHGLIGHPNFKLGDINNTTADNWDGNLHPSGNQSDIDIAIGNWASKAFSDINADPVFFGLPPNPAVVSQALASDGLTLTLTFSEAITGTTGFSVSVGGTNRSVTVTSPDTTHIVLTLGSVAYSTDAVTLSYASGNIVDSGSNALQTFSNRTVTNNSAQSLPATATPTFSVAAGTYSSAQSVTLACSTPSSTIYYTTDGTTPTTLSTTYSGAIAVNATETINAIAAASNHTNSAVATAAYTISIPVVTTITVSPSAPSVSVNATQVFTATVYDQNSNVMNGQTITWSASAGTVTSPGATSTLTAPGTAQTITVTATVGSVHGIATVTVASLGTVATPTFSVVAGSYSSTQSVTLACGTAGASLYYTTDGSTPTTASNAYSGAISVSTTETLKVIASKAAYTNSAIASAAYTIYTAVVTTITISPSTASVQTSGSQVFTASVLDQNDNAMSAQTVVWTTTAGTVSSPGATSTLTAPSSAQSLTVTATIGSVHGAASVTVTTQTVTSTPTFSVAAGSYSSVQTVTLTCSTPSSTIYYTTDGTTPTTSSTIFTTAIAVNATQTIKALAAASGDANSSVASATYTISIPVVTTVTVSPSTPTVAANATQVFTATVYDQNSNVMNGQTVTWSASAGSITSPGATSTLTAPGTAQTVTVTAAVGSVHGTATVTVSSLSQVATPVFSPSAGTYSTVQAVTITCSTQNSSVYYTTDGTTPTTSSSLYSSAISVSVTETIKAIAVAQGMTNSTVASALFTISLSQVATPTFTPSAGTYSVTQSVTLACGTSGASIYYTTDGSTPSTASNAYSGAISVPATETIKAIAVKFGLTNSAVASALFTITAAATAITISPSTITANTNSPVTITIAANGSLASNVAVTLTLSGLTGTFASGTAVVSNGQAILTPQVHSGTVIFTPSADGSGTLTLTNTGGLTNPAPSTVTASSGGGSGDGTLTDDTISAIATSVLDLPDGVEDGMTMRQALRCMTALLLGVETGGSTGTVVFRDINDTTDRVTVSVDVFKNRTAVALNAA